MPTRSEAEENLRVIRSLMEKATIYRAISAPTALVGGLCATAFGLWLYFHWQPQLAPREAEEFGWLFIGGWLVVLAVTASANAIFIWQAARRRGEPFISPAMRKALWALFPPMLCGGFFTLGMLEYGVDEAPRSLPSFWMIFYGLGLLATAQFAPRSIPVLGWFFLVAGLLACIPKYELLGFTAGHRATTANLLMVATFGGFHLIYAALTWPRKSTVAKPGAAP